MKNMYIRKYRKQEAHMGVSYKKLWKLLIDRDMSKTELIRTTNNFTP